jgi:hypothetical protein
MIAYQPVSYVPVPAHRADFPRLSQVAPVPAPVLSTGMVRAALTGGLAVETALGAAGAWVGLWTGLNASGLLKYLGYGVGAMSAISGIVSLAELVIYVGKGLPVPAAPAPAASPGTVF